MILIKSEEYVQNNNKIAGNYFFQLFYNLYKIIRHQSLYINRFYFFASYMTKLVYRWQLL